MKLHLPKGLFVAVMAAMTFVPAAWGILTVPGNPSYSNGGSYVGGG